MIKLITLGFLLFSSSTNAQQTFNKLNANELVVTSTTKASKPCPAMTETQRNAIASPVNGFCIYNTTTSKLNVYNGTIWKAAGGGVDNWGTGTVYAVNDIVIESSKIYQCLIAHTSGTFATDLAASRWVEISSTVPVNLTGPITSVGNATSIASQTGTGSTFVVQNTPTLTTPNIGAATGTSLTLTDRLISKFQSPNNLMSNGDVELTDISMFTCGSGNTCTRTTTSGEYSQGNAALEIDLVAAALNVSQTITTPAGIQKQGYFRVIYNIPAALTDAVLTITVDGTLQTTVPMDKLLKNGLFNTFEVPLTFGSTNVMVKVQTTATYTTGANDVFLDGMLVEQGLGTQNLQGDTSSSAIISSTGVVSRENKDWLNGNCTVSGTSQYDCPIVAGYATLPLNCSSNGSQTSASNVLVVYDTSGSTNTNARFFLSNSTTGAVQAATFSIICQKSGNDYLAASSNVYASQNANYDWTDSGLTTASAFVGFGTPSQVNIKKMRIGSMMYLKGSFTSGTQTSTEYRLPIPDGLTVAGSTKIESNSIVGSWAYSAVLGGSANYFMGAANGNAYLRFFQHTSTVGYSVINTSGPMPGNGSTYYIDVAIPIAEWANPNTIVGSFENVPTVPNAGARIDTFSVRYGTTNTTTACTGSPCLIEQIGNAVSSMTRSSTGLYTINLSKSYTLLICTTATGTDSHVRLTSVSSGSVITLNVTNAIAGAQADTYGSVDCKGTY